MEGMEGKGKGHKQHAEASEPVPGTFRTRCVCTCWCVFCGMGWVCDQGGGKESGRDDWSSSLKKEQRSNHHPMPSTPIPCTRTHAPTHPPIHVGRATMKLHYVYGSLMSPEVLTELLGRVPPLIPATLHGYTRWRVPEQGKPRSQCRRLLAALGLVDDGGGWLIKRRMACLRPAGCGAG